MRYGDALQWLDEIWEEDVEQSEPARARRGDCEMGTARMSPSGRRAPKIVPRTFTWVGESPRGRSRTAISGGGENSQAERTAGAGRECCGREMGGGERQLESSDSPS